MAAYTSPTSKTPMLVRPSGKDPSSSHSTPPIVPISGRSLSTGNSSSHSLQRGSIIIDQPLAITEQFHHASMFNDNYLIVSIVICLMSLIFGCFWTLILSIPAIYYSVKARRALKKTDYREMHHYEKVSFAFNIMVIVCWMISITIVIGVTYRELCGPTGIYCDTAPKHPTPSTPTATPET